MTTFARSNRNDKVTYDAYVENLPDDINEDELRNVFKGFGPIDGIRIMGEGRKIAFIKYQNEADRSKACAENSMSIRGRVIGVRPPRQKSGGDGDGRKRNMQKSHSQYNAPDLLVPNHQQGKAKGNTSPRSSPSVTEEYVEKTIFITHVDGPCDFWAQETANEKLQELGGITENLQVVCPSAQGLTDTPLPGKIYATKFSEDGQWYRCKALKEPAQPGQVHILYIDYGNSEPKSIQELVELPPLLANIEPQASRYVLYGLKPLHYDRDSVGFSQGVDLLKSHTEGQILRAEMVKRKGGQNSNVLPAIIYANDIDINQVMLDNNFAEKRTQKTQSMQGRQMPKQDQSSATGFQSRPPQNMGSSQDFGTTRGFSQQSSDIGNHTRNHFSNMGFSQNQTQKRSSSGQNTMEIGTWDAQPSTQAPPHPSLGCFTNEDPAVKSLQAKLQTALMEKEQLANELRQMHERDTNHIAALKEEVDSLVRENSNSKRHLQDVEDRNQELRVQNAEAAISHKMKNLMVGVRKVKQLRCQFPTDDMTPDPVEATINLVTSPQKISVTNLEQLHCVNATIEAYQNAQDEVRACHDKDLLSDLVNSRNESRKQLHKNISVFLDSISSLPLDARIADLNEGLSSIKKSHAGFLSPEFPEPLGLQEAIQLYKDWKACKLGSFQDVRTMTNTCHNALNSALRLLQQQLSLDDTTENQNPSAVANLDGLLNKFACGVAKEIDQTDVEKTQECSFISITLKTLLSELEKELREIRHLRDIQQEYEKMKKQVEPWLEKSPDITELQTVRKTIKALKSKLRHKLADKQDLEENDGDDSNSLAMEEMKKEISEIRNELHLAFMQEDEILALLADVNEKHFPELAYQFSDYGIENEAMYGGLLKLGRSLDHYSLEPFQNQTKKVISKTVYGGKTSVLKEFLVSESLGVRKGDFLRRAVDYHQISSESLVPVEMVFFTQKDHEVYVQTPFYASTLTNVVNQCALHDLEIAKILSGVLCALRALHNNKLAHGAVHPNNVFVEEGGKGVLAEFDFTKSLKQRSERRFTTSHGLLFEAPEIKTHTEVTRASDIFNFGLLAVYMHFPNIHFKLESNGVIDLSGVSVPNELHDLLNQTLQEEPSQRPTAAELQSFSYFRAAKSQRETLQLRPKVTSPPPEKKVGNGILKNGTGSPPPLEETNGYQDVGSPPSIVEPLEMSSAKATLVETSAEFENNSPIQGNDNANCEYEENSSSPQTPAKQETQSHNETLEGKSVEEVLKEISTSCSPLLSPPGTPMNTPEAPTPAEGESPQIRNALIKADTEDENIDNVLQAAAKIAAMRPQSDLHEQVPDNGSGDNNGEIKINGKENGNVTLKSSTRPISSLEKIRKIVDDANKQKLNQLTQGRVREIEGNMREIEGNLARYQMPVCVGSVGSGDGASLEQSIIKQCDLNKD